MEFFKHNTTIDFMGQRKWAALCSILLFSFSIFSLAYYGLNWGLDFTGGTQIQVNFQEAPDLNQIRMNLEGSGFKDASVVNYGTSKAVLITLPPKEEEKTAATQRKLTEKDPVVGEIMRILPTGTINQVNYIGPNVGKEMATKGWLAIAIALLGTMIYIAFRFETRFAIGSTVALIHDPIIILGIFSFFHIEFNLIALTAVLTVIGYSLNDTIVIFDRVRENFRKLRKGTPLEVMNQAINQTLSRTIMTSVLTLIVILALFFLGGSVLHGFSLAFIIGIIVGTYSSIYVAGSLAISLGLDRHNLMPAPRAELDSRP